MKILTAPSLAVGGRTPCLIAEVLPLLAPHLDLPDLASLGQASKPLLAECLGLSEQELQCKLQQLLKEKKVKSFYSRTHLENDSFYSSLAWLLAGLAKRWGIMQLAARLDLQQALLAAEGDAMACYILINYGARVTRPLLRMAGINAGPVNWVHAYRELKLCWSLPKIFFLALNSSSALQLDSQGLDSQLLFEVLAATLKSQVHPLFIVAAILDAADAEELAQWSLQQVQELALLAAKVKCSGSLCLLMQHPAAQLVSPESSFHSDLFVSMFQPGFEAYALDLLQLILPGVQWDQQLLDRVIAALGQQPQGEHCSLEAGHACVVCKLLISVRSVASQRFTASVMIRLLRAARTFRSHTARTLLLLLAGTVTEPEDAVAAVAAALNAGLSSSYTEFKRLVGNSAVQGLPLPEVQQLLVQAAAAGCSTGLGTLAAFHSAAQELTGEGLQQLFGMVIEETSCSEGGSTASNSLLIETLANVGLPALKQLQQQEVQLLMAKCLRRDDGQALRRLIKVVPEARRIPSAAICELMVQAAAAEAVACLLVLLQQVSHPEDLCLDVLRPVLPVLLRSCCGRKVASPSSVVGEVYPGCRVSSCSVCSALEAASPQLEAADVWDLLMGAARSAVVPQHLEGLATLPGLDELTEQRVEQLLLGGIKGMGLEEQDVQSQLKKLQLLKKVLNMNKLVQLPLVAVHRLMMACVGKAVEGGVARVKQELGLPEQGWEGSLGQEQVKQLLGVAVKCSCQVSHSEIRGQAADCRPCLLLLAEFLPSATEQLQLVRALDAAQVGLIQEWQKSNIGVRILRLPVPPPPEEH